VCSSDLSRELRENLKTGYHQECWDKAFKDDDDE
jgi:hypothetical protein